MLYVKNWLVCKWTAVPTCPRTYMCVQQTTCVLGGSPERISIYTRKYVIKCGLNNQITFHLSGHLHWYLELSTCDLFVQDAF